MKKPEGAPLIWDKGFGTETRPETRSTQSATASASSLTTIAWWPMPACSCRPLARHLGLRELVDHHLDLGGAPGRANTGDKMLTLVASALAGGDCIDDADALRAGGTVGVLGCVVKAPSTLGTFLRSFRWGHVRQLDRVSRQLLARAWAAGAGPGDSPLSIDLDSTICETYGLAKEGARHHGYTGARGYHPLLAIAAGICPGCARAGPTRPWRRPFLRETVGRVRYGPGDNSRCGPTGFYAHTVVAGGCPLLYHHLPARQPAGPDPRRYQRMTPALPSDQELDGRRRRCRRDDLHPVELIVRRVKPTPGPQLRSCHAFITDRDGETLELEADLAATPRSRTPYATSSGVGLNHMPSASPPTAPGWRSR